MARQWFKRAWTKIVPPVVERSTYVLIASLMLALLFWQWQPMGPIVWDVHNPTGRTLLKLYFGLAGEAFWFLPTWSITSRSSDSGRFTTTSKEEKQSRYPFQSPALYKMVRHPLYLGFIVAFWSTPRMTFGHLFFAIMTTGYILVAIQFEERDLIQSYGDTYREYRQRVSMLIPAAAKNDRTGLQQKVFWLA